MSCFGGLSGAKRRIYQHLHTVIPLIPPICSYLIKGFKLYITNHTVPKRSVLKNGLDVLGVSEKLSSLQN